MTSEPPRASFWATPPEFYLDENTVTRSVRRLLAGLGYSVHTPAELFGDRTASLGAADEEWLNLSEIGVITSSRKVGTWYMTESGPTEYDVATD